MFEAGRSAISQVDLFISDPQQRFSVNRETAVSEHGVLFPSLLTDGLRLTRVTDMERAEDAFRLRNLAPAQRVAIFLEVSETLPRVATPSQVSPMASPAQVGGSTVLQMRVEARWSNASTPDLLRVKHSVCPLPRGLPFSITVKDFFRARKSVAPLAVTL